MRALAGRVEVRGLTRSPRSADQVRCDLEDPSSIVNALAGADALFLTTTPYEGGVAAEERQALNAICAAREAGLRQIIYSSVAGARARTGVAHYESKGRIEGLLEDKGFPFLTILRPTFFMDMFLDQAFRRALSQGKIEMSFRSDTRIAMIAVDDIAAFVRLAIEAPERLSGHQIDLAGACPTMPEVARAMEQALGRSIRYRRVPPGAMAADVRPKASTQQWIESVGWKIQPGALRARYGLDLTGNESWATLHRDKLANWKG